MGNSDHSLPRTPDPATSLKAAAPLWHAFVEEYTKKWPIAKFQRPSKVVTATIDAWSGGKPGPWTRETRKEFFVRGTQPTARNAVDKAGLLYSVCLRRLACRPRQGGARSVSLEPRRRGVARRARRGVGVVGRWDAATAYLPGESSWGGPLIGQCPRPKP